MDKKGKGDGKRPFRRGEKSDERGSKGGGPRRAGPRKDGERRSGPRKDGARRDGDGGPRRDGERHRAPVETASGPRSTPRRHAEGPRRDGPRREAAAQDPRERSTGSAPRRSTPRRSAQDGERSSSRRDGPRRDGPRRDGDRRPKKNSPSNRRPQAIEQLTPDRGSGAAKRVSLRWKALSSGRYPGEAGLAKVHHRGQNQDKARWLSAETPDPRRRTPPCDDTAAGAVRCTSSQRLRTMRASPSWPTYLRSRPRRPCADVCGVARWKRMPPRREDGLRAVGLQDAPARCLRAGLAQGAPSRLSRCHQPPGAPWER